MTTRVDIAKATDAWIGLVSHYPERATAIGVLRGLIGQPSDSLASQCFDDEEWPALTPEERVVEIRAWLALEAPADRRCGTCRFYDPENEIEGQPAEDQMSWCKWPGETLPWSLRYGNRERVMVGPLEGKDCAQWKGGRYVETKA